MIDQSKRSRHFSEKFTQAIDTLVLDFTAIAMTTSRLLNGEIQVIN